MRRKQRHRSKRRGGTAGEVTHSVIQKIEHPLKKPTLADKAKKELKNTQNQIMHLFGKVKNIFKGGRRRRRRTRRKHRRRRRTRRKHRRRRGTCKRKKLVGQRRNAAGRITRHGRYKCVSRRR